MLKKKKIIQSIILILACLILAFGAFYLKRQKFETSQINPEGKIYLKLVTDKDREPLPVPPEVIKNDRALTIPILMYHHVGDLPKNAGKTQTDLTVSTASFKAQVKWINSNSYTGVSLEDIYLASQNKFAMPKKPVVFTFDDGYSDVFQNAVPILKEYGYTGSFAIITQNPGTTAGNNVYAPWQAIAQAYLGGNEIVSHTQNHFDGSNPKFSANYIYQNLSGSLVDIRQNLGTTTNILIYPYGHYSNMYIEQAKKAGFVMGVTVHEGKIINLDDLMKIPRVRVHGAETLQRFEELILK